MNFPMYSIRICDLENEDVGASRSAVCSEDIIVHLVNDERSHGRTDLLSTMITQFQLRFNGVITMPKYFARHLRPS